ncbi:hypothetical protein SK128_003881, partial [Halocaridina rubra]
MQSSVFFELAMQKNSILSDTGLAMLLLLARTTYAGPSRPSSTLKSSSAACSAK